MKRKGKGDVSGRNTDSSATSGSSTTSAISGTLAESGSSAATVASGSSATSGSLVVYGSEATSGPSVSPIMKRKGKGEMSGRILRKRVTMTGVDNKVGNMEVVAGRSGDDQYDADRRGHVMRERGGGDGGCGGSGKDVDSLEYESDDDKK